MSAHISPATVQLPVQDIHYNNLNVRLNIQAEDLQSLVQSIAEQGLLHPIIVRPHPAKPDQYQLLCGERRLRGFHTLLELHGEQSDYAYIPARVAQASDADALALMYQENEERRSWSQYERSLFYKKAFDSGAYASMRLTATSLGLGITTLHRYLKIFELPKYLQDKFQKGALSLAQMEVFVEADPAMYKVLLQGFAEGWSKNDARNVIRGQSELLPPDEITLEARAKQRSIRWKKSGKNLTITVKADSLGSALKELLALQES